jgi:predicted transcriptional regulator
MVRRSRLEIYFDVLKVINNGVVKPTRIMYKTNLSWFSLQKVFDSMIDGGFIREERFKKSKRYFITEKGRRALSYYTRSLNELLPVIQELRT